MLNTYGFDGAFRCNRFWLIFMQSLPETCLPWFVAAWRRVKSYDDICARLNWHFPVCLVEMMLDISRLSYPCAG